MALLRRRRRKRRGERGAVAVEAALILPVIMLLVFGMIDMSLLLRDYVSVTAATRAASRLAAAEADAGPCVNQAGDTTTCPTTSPPYVPEVAQDAADTMQANLTGVPGTSVQYMLVYEANQYGYPCLTAKSRTVASRTVSTNNCNPALAASAGAADVNKTMPTTCIGYGNCVMFKWSPTALSGAGAFRYYAAGSTGWNSAVIAACTNKEDSVGVYLNLQHQWITGVLGVNPYTLQDKSVMKFEPLSDDACDSTKTSPHQ